MEKLGFPGAKTHPVSGDTGETLEHPSLETSLVVEKPFISNRQYVLLSPPLENRQCYLNKLFPEKLLKVTAGAPGQLSSPRSRTETKLLEREKLPLSPAVGAIPLRFLLSPQPSQGLPCLFLHLPSFAKPFPCLHMSCRHWSALGLSKIPSDIPLPPSSDSLCGFPQPPAFLVLLHPPLP